MTAVARVESVSRSWTSREANSPEVRHRIAEAIDARADRVGDLTDHAFDVIAGAMAAEQQQLDKLARSTRSALTITPVWPPLRR